MGGNPGGGGFCQEYDEAQEAQFGRRCPQRMEWRFQNAAFGKGMRIWIHLRIVENDDSVISEDELPQLDKGCDRLEAIGRSLAGTKAVLANTRKGWSRRGRLLPLDQCRDCGFPRLPAAQQLVAPDPVPYHVRHSPADQPAPLSLSPPIRGGHDLQFVN
jgi:hypothetical protein